MSKQIYLFKGDMVVKEKVYVELLEACKNIIKLKPELEILGWCMNSGKTTFAYNTVLRMLEQVEQAINHAEGKGE